MNGRTGATPNLARRPFLNTRPVVRVAILLTVLGVLLAAANLFAYWSFSEGQDVQTDRLEATRAQIVDTREQIFALEERRQQIDLESQNEQVQFLNRKIEQRTFGWSLLFDTLSEILPRDVRISRLSLDAVEEDQRRGPRARSGDDLRPGEIVLGIEGEARNFEAFIDFVDQLFASPAFRRVDPSGDQKIRTGMSRFTLTVVYLPEKAATLEREADEAEARRAENAATDGDAGTDTDASTDDRDPEDGAATGSTENGTHTGEGRS